VGCDERSIKRKINISQYFQGKTCSKFANFHAQYKSDENADKMYIHSVFIYRILFALGQIYNKDDRILIYSQKNLSKVKACKMQKLYLVKKSNFEFW